MSKRLLLPALALACALPPATGYTRSPPPQTILEQNFGPWELEVTEHSYAQRQKDKSQSAYIRYTPDDRSYAVTIWCSGYASSAPGDWWLSISRTETGVTQKGKAVRSAEGGRVYGIYAFDGNIESLSGRGVSGRAIEYGRLSADDPKMVTSFVRNALQARRTLVVNLGGTSEDLTIPATGLRQALEKAMDYCPLY